MEEGAPLPCPHCPGRLHRVAARARSGYLIELDQCPTCGGIWCDPWEAYPIPAAEARRLDRLDEKGLHARTDPATEPGRCPRCAIALRPFRDPAIRPDARIERCRACQGMWLNRGELARWKGQQPSGPGPSDATLARVAEAYAAEAKWPTVQNLDRALDAPPDPELEGDGVRAAIRSTAAWIVLRFLLRLLLRN